MEVIQRHGALCEEVYDFLLEENRRYRQLGKPLNSGLIEKKRSLLARLNESLDGLRGIGRQGGVARSSVLKKAVERAQRVLLRTMLLDKENEQLFLKHALSASPGAFQIIPKPTAKQVQKKYLARE
jgi:hypothetical protein